MTKSKAQEDAVIAEAIAILLRRAVRGEALASPEACREYWRVALSGLDYEVFCVAYLDSQLGLVAQEEMFRGTLTQTAVYPREVVKGALRHHAASVIFAHNHPSGVAEPSRADEHITIALKQALALIDVRVLDHFIIAGTKATSFAERGLI